MSSSTLFGNFILKFERIAHIAHIDIQDTICCDLGGHFTIKPDYSMYTSSRISLSGFELVKPTLGGGLVNLDYNLDLRV